MKVKVYVITGIDRRGNELARVQVLSEETRDKIVGDLLTEFETVRVETREETL